MNDAVSIAAAVRQGKVSAVEVTKAKAALAQIATRDNQLNCFTAVTAEAGLTHAARIDREIAQGNHSATLAKNLSFPTGKLSNPCIQPA